MLPSIYGSTMAIHVTIQLRRLKRDLQIPGGDYLSQLVGGKAGKVNGRNLSVRYKSYNGDIPRIHRRYVRLGHHSHSHCPSFSDAACRKKNL